MIAWRLERHAALPSTSDALIARALAEQPAGTAILADRQTGGRGRAGRAWHSPVGNLYLSALLRPGGPAREAPQFALLAGVALIETAQRAGAEGLGLKWPNDLLRDGVKCAGILAETGLAPDGTVAWLVLGFGVNLAAAPTLPDRPTTTLGGRPEAPDAFADRLLLALAHWQDRHAAHGFAPIRAAWTAHGPPIGSPVTLRSGPSGHFAGLAEDGSLLLDTAGGRRRITAGEAI